jgi:putative transposase
LTPEVEKAAHGALRQRVLGFPGVILHALDGTENHVHLAVSIPPTVLISTFVGDVKGASSFTLNQLFGAAGERFAWQAGYGVVSFGTKDLPWVVGYINRQKEHHAAGTAHQRLERMISEEEEPTGGSDGERTEGEQGPGGPAVAPP